MIQTTNPFTEKPIAPFSFYSNEEIELRLKKSDSAYENVRSVSISQRATLMQNLAEAMELNRAKLVQLAVSEMGKPILEAYAEISKCVFSINWFAEHGEKLMEPEMRDAGGKRALVRFDPLGVILGIMPWNFPYWQVIRFAVPALLAGNTVLLKHAPNVTGCALALEALFKEAGFPEGMYSAVIASNEQVSSLIADSRVKALSFTGSTATGRVLAEQCGKLLKPSVLELGGSDAFIVLDDADIELAAQKAVASRFINSGQSCIAAKRLIVVDAVYEQFRNRLLELLHQLTVGDPVLETTKVGPLARKDLVEQLKNQVEKSVLAGASVLYQSKIPKQGFFYSVTILENVTPEMPVYSEETFGPVAPLIRVKDETEAVRLANQSRYALGAAVFSGNLDRAMEVAKLLNAGAVYINELVYSDARLPFGGNGDSGWGRELAEYGLRSFCNTKTVLLS